LTAGLNQHPAGEAYSTPPDLLAGLRGAYFEGRGGEGKEGERKGK